MPPHTPKPEVIIYAVSKPFNTTPEEILSDSRKDVVVVPREVCAYLMQASGFMRLSEISRALGLGDRWLKKAIGHVRERARVDTDFANRIWQAQMIILQLNTK